MHAITISAVTIVPTVGVNIVANAMPNGAFDFARSALGTIPAITLVDTM